MEMLQTLVFGLLLGSIYALMASGLTIIFGVMKVVNLAHGVFILIGAYGAYLLSESIGLDPILAVPVIAVPLYLLGALTYRVLFQRIEGTKRFTEMTVLLTFGLALIVEGLIGYFYTGIYRSVSTSYATEAFIIGDLFIPRGQLYSSLLSLVILWGLYAFLHRTETGNAIRATMQNRNAAQFVGVNVGRISMVTFGIGIMLAGFAGPLTSYLFAFFPARHWQWISILLSLVVLGGLGSIKGAVIGAFALSAVSALVSQYFGPVWSPLTFYLALFLILLVRPQGLYGKAVAA